jgi:hypothetical protein
MTDYSTMKSYRCPKCGLRAASKGPGRSMIPGFSAAGATCVAGIMTFKVEPDPYREGSSDLVLRMSMFGDFKDDREKAIEHLHALMQQLTLEDVKQGSCSHDWELDPPDQVE